MGRTDGVCSCGVGELALLHIHVPADDGDDELFVFLTCPVIDERSDHEDCFGGLAGFDTECGAELVDCL